MAYNTFGRYRYTLKDSARRVRNSRIKHDNPLCPACGQAHMLDGDDVCSGLPPVGTCLGCGEATNDGGDWCFGNRCRMDGE